MAEQELLEPEVQTPVARPVPPPRGVVTRRTLLLGGFWTTLALAVVGVMGAIIKGSVDNPQRAAPYDSASVAKGRAAGRGV